MMIVDLLACHKIIYCQKLPRISYVLTAFYLSPLRENEISQAAQSLRSQIYSRNVDIHRLWQDIPRFFFHFLAKSILLTKH